MTLQTISSFTNKNSQCGTLYLVPTPIGNLSDMTPRAVETLKNVDLICAEDTRNTARLLAHFEVGTPQISFHEHNTYHRVPQLLEKLQAGLDIAQVSDAGMPSISDPGYLLVQQCTENNISVVPLPGPNAALTALIASGLVPQPFYFFGFLPRKKSAQQAQLKALQSIEATLIFYEAPHRLKETLANIAATYDENRRVVLCRELTKKYEQFIRGTAKEVADWAYANPVRGEFVVLVQGQIAAEKAAIAIQQAVPQLPLEEAIAEKIAAGIKPTKAIKQVAKERNMDRHEVYNRYHHLD